MPSKRLRTFTFRLPNEYYIAIVRLANRERVPVTPSRYVRDVVREHLRQKYYARPGVNLLSPFIRTVKDFIITYHGLRIASNLPAEPRREQLENLPGIGNGVKLLKATG